MTEAPIYFPCGDQSLFGVLAVPDGGSDALVVVAAGGGFNSATFQRNRVAARLSHRLSETGLAVLRFDYHGVGDSTGLIPKFDLERPFRDDIGAAIAWGKGVGFQRIGVVGVCFGSRTALTAVDTGEDLAAIVLMAMPFADVMTVIAKRMGLTGVVRRLLQPTTWTRLGNAKVRRRYTKVLRSLWRHSVRRGSFDSSPRPFSAQSRLEAAVARKIPVLMLYGRNDNCYINAQSNLDSLLAKSSTIEVDASYSGQLHQFLTIESQDVFVEKVATWLPPKMEAGRTAAKTSA